MLRRVSIAGKEPVAGFEFTVRIGMRTAGKSGFARRARNKARERRESRPFPEFPL
jgi:hypothetical protein